MLNFVILPWIVEMSLAVKVLQPYKMSSSTPYIVFNMYWNKNGGYTVILVKYDDLLK